MRLRLRPGVFASALLLATVAAGAAAADLGGLLKHIFVQPPEQKPAQEAPVAQPGLFSDVSPEQEAQIGRQIAGNLLGAAPLVRQEGLQRYVNRVGRWVAAQSERPDLPWRFGIVRSEDVNAFAIPGGYVFLTEGLFRQLRNEAELGGVLGHEIGHVVRRHHLALLKKSQLVGLVGNLLGQVVNKDGNQLIQNLIGNGAEILARGLDKDAEYEADRMGVVLATRAGYDPYGLPLVLSRIGQIKPGDSSVALLFKTHPRPDDRLLHLGDAMGESFERFSQGKSVERRFAGVAAASGSTPQP